jgi:predicted nuclease of predicted toxin-antitoxin system
MRFLLDENLSPRLAEVLRASGHDVQHVHEIGLTGASDHLVLERARADSRVLISADTDFGAILVRSQATTPSFLLLRRAANRRVIAQAAVILDNLDAVQADLDAGAVVVLSETTLRIHRLPIGSD